MATNETTQLPQDWQWSGAEHRRYTREEIDQWRQLARKEVEKEKPMEMARKDYMGSMMVCNVHLEWMCVSKNHCCLKLCSSSKVFVDLYSSVVLKKTMYLHLSNLRSPKSLRKIK